MYSYYFCLAPDKQSEEVVKNLSVSVGDSGWIPEWGRSPGKGNGNPLQYSCLGNHMVYAEYIRRNAGLDEAQAGIKIAERNINNLNGYADDTILTAENKKN